MKSETILVSLFLGAILWSCCIMSVVFILRSIQ